MKKLKPTLKQIQDNLDMLAETFNSVPYKRPTKKDEQPVNEPKAKPETTE